jgi:triacylglycerol lipase
MTDTKIRTSLPPITAGGLPQPDRAGVVDEAEKNEVKRGPFGLPLGFSLPELVPTIVRGIKGAAMASSAPFVSAARAVEDVFDSPGSAGKAGWALEGATPATDVTARFKELFAANRAGKSILPASASQYAYLLVPGLLADHYPGYLADNEQVLRDASLEVHVAKVKTQARVEENAKIIRDALLEACKSGKQVVVIGHSKGAVDAMSSVSLYPEIRHRVRALISMQGSYGGSIIASDLLDSKTLAPVARATVSRLFGGDANSLTDVTYDSRRKFLEEHPYPQGIDTVSLATSRLSPRSILSPLEHYLKARYGYANDGLLTLEDQIVPGSRVVKLDNVDHAEGALRGLPGFSDQTPGELTLALVALALEDKGRTG